MVMVSPEHCILGISFHENDDDDYDDHDDNSLCKEDWGGFLLPHFFSTDCTTDCVELSCEFWFWAHVLFLLTDGVLLLGSTTTVTSGGGGSCRFLALDFCFLFLVIAGREWEALMKPMLLLVQCAHTWWYIAESLGVGQGALLSVKRVFQLSKLWKGSFFFLWATLSGNFPD